MKEWDSHSGQFHPHRMSCYHCRVLFSLRGHLQGVCCMLFLNKLTPQTKNGIVFFSVITGLSNIAAVTEEKSIWGLTTTK